ncbi:MULTISPECIES: lytic murein transglycosylase [unclassified Modicisalibacter]|uniref:lytic murein transglycosylase n=1 Tax=unclassified Modicisalibacter TaxID=2679913 RepID=UPI001CCEF71E|nr:MULTISPECIES: lytic murein transglycosylase [unclassified Modicisalibacter]
MPRRARYVPLALIALLPMSGCQVAAQPAAADGGTASPASTVASAASETASAPREGQASPGDTRPAFSDWVSDFRGVAREQGIDAATLDAAFDDIEYLPSVIRHDRAQPEFTRQVWDYLDTAVSAARVRQGRSAWEAHRQAIAAAGQRYGVPPEVLVAIWGIESNYGGNFGNYETIDALATLGYDGRRPDFARSELLSALRILQRGDIDREHMRGSWAGAMGHTQFLPSSFEQYARDADGDGRRDIWGSVADVMASTAYYLSRVGWRQGEPWGIEVRLPDDFDYARTELDVRQDSRAWAAQGVTARHAGALPTFSDASVIAPAGDQGPAFLVGGNFRVIMRYNASTSYALAVGLLADRLAGRPGLVADWPRDEPALSRRQVELLQRRLNAAGFDVGAPDGVIGPNTRGGVRAYQRSLGETPDGFATLELLERLGDG